MTQKSTEMVALVGATGEIGKSVAAAHAPARIKTIILRLPDFYGPGVERSLLSDLFIAAKQNRKAKLIGPIDRAHEFVFVPDVGPVAAKLLDTPEALGRAWNLEGAGVTTQLELARLAYKGHPRFMTAGKMMLRLLGLFDPFLREFVECTTYPKTDMVVHSFNGFPVATAAELRDLFLALRMGGKGGTEGVD